MFTGTSGAMAEHNGIEPTQVDERTLVADVARNAGISSPLRRMPTEMLSEIFSLTLGSDGRTNVKNSPWTLSHTCSRWRAIAIDSPSLWSFIAINCGGDFKDLAVLHPLPLLRTQLSRATRLRLHFEADCTGAHAHYQTALFELFVEYSAKWFDVDLTLLTGLLPAMEGIRGRVPLLHNLSLGWFTSTPDAEVNIDCFIDAPALRSVDLRLERYPTVSFPYSPQLTRYRLNGPWKRHLDIFQQSAPSLIEARVYVLEEQSPDARRVVPGGKLIELPNLQLLYLSHSDIMDSLRVPALRELGLLPSDSELPRHVNSPHYIDAMVLRSCCTLQALRVVGVDASAVTEILRNHRGITEFVYVAAGVESGRDASAVVSGLSAKSDSSGAFTLAPQLARVKFFAIDDRTADIDTNGDVDWTPGYLDMILSRRKAPVCHLKSVALVVQRDYDVERSIKLQVDELRTQSTGDFRLLVAKTDDDDDSVAQMVVEWLFDLLG
ncbi:hypothetical protein C8R46DRAFT_1048056 [Mycena filopes]|nr:hypothetical protein C8R46DRAFT_1048056 [Mycena filopes]